MDRERGDAIRPPPRWPALADRDAPAVLEIVRRGPRHGASGKRCRPAMAGRARLTRSSPAALRSRCWAVADRPVLLLDTAGPSRRPYRQHAEALRRASDVRASSSSGSTRLFMPASASEPSIRSSGRRSTSWASTGRYLERSAMADIPAGTGLGSGESRSRQEGARAVR